MCTTSLQSYKNNRYFRKKEERNESGERNSRVCVTFHSRSPSGSIFRICIIQHIYLLSCRCIADSQHLCTAASIETLPSPPYRPAPYRNGSTVRRNDQRIHLPAHIRGSNGIPIESDGGRIRGKNAGGDRPHPVQRYPLQRCGKSTCHRRKM